NTCAPVGGYLCGNGRVDPGEMCDGSVPGTECCAPDCTLRPAGQVCRPAVSTVCDVAESCDGLSGACPADRVADPTTSCSVQDPCTIRDHCAHGECAPGLSICGAVAGQPCVSDLFPCRAAGKKPAPVIGVQATVDRANLPGPGKFAAIAFEPAPAP